MTKLEDIKPPQCFARATRLLADARSVREELGRLDDQRPALEVTGALPRECYFEAIVVWRKLDRLAAELGVGGAQVAPAMPPLAQIVPGHVLGLIDGALARMGEIQARLGIAERAPEPAIEPTRQPSDVLVTLIRVNREVSRALERPFTPSDVFETVARASAYATRIGAAPPTIAHERKRKPADCYAKLSACLQLARTAIEKRGGQALQARGEPGEIVPGDVYDLAGLVLGEVAYLLELAKVSAPSLLEPAPGGHQLPSHVYQLARVLEAQLGTLG